MNICHARVLAAPNKFEEGLKVLDGLAAGSHQSSVEEARGDLLLGLGREDEARVAYQTAVDSLVEGAQKPVLQMKLDELAVSSSVAPVEEVENVAADEAAGDTGES